MKGAFLVAEDEGLFDTSKQVLLSLGGQVSADGAIVQLLDDAEGLFMIYRVAPESEWEFKTGVLRSASGAKLPDMNRMNGVAVECRSESQFVVLVEAIARANTEDTWVIDGDGVVWRASQIDPSLVRL